METLLQQTTTLVSSLQATWAQSLVDTNPLAEWANQALLLDARTDAEGRPLAVVNVGRAHKLDQSNGYEHQDRWLYPHYRAWVDDTGGKPLSSRRFTGLVCDLFENQLRLDGVEHRDGNKGSQFCGMRLRTDQDADQPCLITHHPPPVTDGTPPVTAETDVSDGCDTCDGFVQGVHAHPSPVCASGDPIQGAAIPVSERVNHSSNTSYPSLSRGASVTTPVPPVTEALAEDALKGGEWVWLLSKDGVQQHGRPYQIRAIDLGPAGHRYARFAEMPTGWPLAQCVRADPPATARPSPCTVCGGTERWDDGGIMRCVTCWPSNACRTDVGANVAVSAPGTIEGDRRCE